jgi:glutathione S-transferase
MLRIFGYAASINVRKVLWACAELGLAYQREDWGLPERPTSDPYFRSLNPVGLVPVIDDAGTIVWESNAIVRYLAASRNRDDLLPIDPAKRARVEMWMDWQASDFNNSWRVAVQGLLRKNPEFMDPRAIERSVTAFSLMVEMVDRQLADTRAYICGADFTVADIAIGLSVHRWRSLPVNRPKLSNIELYYDLLCERPGFRDHGRDGGA